MRRVYTAQGKPQRPNSTLHCFSCTPNSLGPKGTVTLVFRANGGPFFLQHPKLQRLDQKSRSPDPCPQAAINGGAVAVLKCLAGSARGLGLTVWGVELVKTQPAIGVHGLLQYRLLTGLSGVRGIEASGP